MVMGFVAHSPPNFGAALTSLGVPEGPIVTELFVSLPLYYRVSWAHYRPVGTKQLTTHDTGQRHDEYGP